VEGREKREYGRIKKRSPKFEFGILRLFLLLFYYEPLSDIFMTSVQSRIRGIFSVRLNEVTKHSQDDATDVRAKLRIGRPRNRDLIFGVVKVEFHCPKPSGLASGRTATPVQRIPGDKAVVYLLVLGKVSLKTVCLKNGI
jgi:hypothetical protein